MNQNNIIENNFLTQQLNGVPNFNSDALQKAENWRSRIDVVKIESALNKIKDEYHMVEEAHKRTLDASLRNKKELDQQLMKLFDVSRIDKLKYQWIEGVLVKGNLDGVLYSATEEEQEIINSARARLTEDKVAQFKQLVRQQGISMGKEQALAKEVEDKKKKVDEAEKINSQASINSYKKKVERLKKLHERIKLLATQHNDKIKRLKERQAENVERIRKKQEQLKENVEQSTNIVTNYRASISNVSFTRKLMLVEKMVEEGNISEKQAISLISPIAKDFQLSTLEKEALSDEGKKAYDRCDELRVIVEGSMDADKDVCDNPIPTPNLKDRMEITSIMAQGDKLLQNIEIGAKDIDEKINGLAEMSISNQLEQYDQMSRELTNSMAKVEEKFNMPDLSKYNENQLEGALRDMEQKIDRLENGDKEIEVAFEETTKQTDEVEADIDANINKNNAESAEYSFGSNSELLKEFDVMIELGSSCEHMPKYMQDAYTQYIYSQIDELKMSSNQISKLTGRPIPDDLKDKVQTIEEQLKKDELEATSQQDGPVLEYKPRDDDD